ncbi:MAG: ABC transporter permease [Chthonomonadales bacterium]|nr:ABC transporter permease [Chthonomonadales bacterium]
MRSTLAVAQRELRAYFAAPMGWVALAVFLAFAGYFFYAGVAFAGFGDLRSWFIDTTIILIILMPALTMRLVAEERQTGTIEVLMTSPITDTQAILGKYLGGLGFYSVMLLLTVQYPVALTRMGSPDMGPIYAGYVGMLLFGATFLAVGLLVSTMTKSQVVAYVGSLFVLLFLWLLVWASEGDAWWQRLLAYIAIPTHLESFTKGLIDTRDIFFYLTFIGAALFLSVRALAAWKWR